MEPGESFKMHMLWLCLVLCLTTPFGYAAKPINLAGTVQVLSVDGFTKDQKSELLYFLQVTKGEQVGQRVEIIFDRNLPDMLTGDYLSGQAMHQPNGSWRMLNWSIQSKQRITPAVVGKRSALYIRVNLLDATLSLTEAQLIEKMGMTRDRYLNASFGKLDFPLDVDSNGRPDFISVNIDQSKNQGCDYWAISNKALAAAQAAGVNLGLYSHRIVIFPEEVGCWFAGVGTVGCSGSCNVWLPGGNLDDVYIHELGHNLGLLHAATDVNDDSVIEYEYGDASCVMGSHYYSGHFNSPHTAQMGWLTAANVSTLTQPGNYKLYALSQNPSLGLSTLMHIKRDPRSYYYLSYRPQTEFDQVGEPFTNGLSLYYTVNNGRQTQYVTTIGVGETWISPSVRLRVVAKDDTSVSFDAKFDCFQPPQLTLTPGVASVYPGSSANLKLAIKNLNPTTCAPMSVGVSAVIPTGFSAQLPSASISVAPSTEKIVIIPLQTSLIRGHHSIMVKAKENGEDGSIPIEAATHVYVQRYPVRTLPGLVRSHYSGVWGVMPDFSTLTADSTDIVDRVLLDPFGDQDYFGLVFNGFLKIDEAGTYTFSAASDDGSKVYVQDRLLINNDGLHGTVEKFAKINLKPGIYPLRIEYFEAAYVAALQFFYQKDSEPKKEVPASMLVRMDSSNLPPIVNAGPDQKVLLGQEVVLKGTVSDEFEIDWARWQRISGPIGIELRSVAANRDMTLEYRVLPTVPGTYVYELVAQDMRGLFAKDRVNVVVEDPGV
jgi:hypothetical protein